MFSKKNKKKAFTLIEMLIVIVIIGILAAAIFPKLSNARGRANDVARKAGLSQIAAALVAYQIDKGGFPTTAGSLSSISGQLLWAGMSSLLEDPNTSRVFSGITNATIPWQYGYTPIIKSWIGGNGFVLMAATETEWWSNRIVAGSMPTISASATYDNISSSLCKWFSSSGTPGQRDADWTCHYDKNADQLRYIYLY